MNLRAAVKTKRGGILRRSTSDIRGGARQRSVPLDGWVRHLHVGSWFAPTSDRAVPAIELDLPSRRIPVVPNREGAKRINFRRTAKEPLHFDFGHALLKPSPVHLFRCHKGRSTSLAQLLFKISHSAFKDSNSLFKLLYPRLKGRLGRNISSCSEN